GVGKFRIGDGDFPPVRIPLAGQHDFPSGLQPVLHERPPPPDRRHKKTVNQHDAGQFGFVPPPHPQDRLPVYNAFDPHFLPVSGIRRMPETAILVPEREMFEQVQHGHDAKRFQLPGLLWTDAGDRPYRQLLQSVHHAGNANTASVPGPACAPMIGPTSMKAFGSAFTLATIKSLSSFAISGELAWPTYSSTASPPKSCCSSSTMRFRAFFWPRTLSTGATSPASSTVRIGLMLSSEPNSADALPMRPPLYKYCSVSTMK